MPTGLEWRGDVCEDVVEDLGTRVKGSDGGSIRVDLIGWEIQASIPISKHFFSHQSAFSA